MDEKIENCAPPETDAKAFDYSNFEFIAMSDTDVYMNGTIRMARKFVSIIPYHVYAEKFDRNQWNLAVYNAKRDDFCKALHDPTEVWYSKFKRVKGCPLEIGVSF